MREQQAASIGLNRTGVAMSPIDSKDIVEAAHKGSPRTPGGMAGLASVRGAYARDAEPVGSVPPPTTLRSVVRTAVEVIRGHVPTVLVNRLGERLAFERTGVRLYDALLAKFDAADRPAGGPTRVELERFHDDELEHFHLLKRAIEELGADPTAMTPSADLIGVASRGLLQVITDPRTTMGQSLEALLTAELTDNDAWQLLGDTLRALGKDDLAQRFARAQQQEAVHLAHVRKWISDEVIALAKADLGRK